MSCNLNTINSGCAFSVAGLQKIALIPYGDVINLEYNPNFKSYITDYQLLSIPVEWKVGKDASFSSSADITGNSQLFNHQLSFNIELLEANKREEFEKLRNREWHAIIQDKNNQCIFLGESSPLKVTSIEKTTGTSNGGTNEYTITLSCIADWQAKFIKCYDSNCFNSFVGSEIRSSLFTIPNASFFVGLNDLQIVADVDLLSLTTSTILAPNTWPSATDLATIQNLIGTRGTVSNLTYDALNDTAYFIIQSVDTSFDYFSASTSNPYRASRTIELNLQVLLGQIASASTVTVSDSFGSTLYSGLATDIITGVPNIGGTVGNATLVVSALYTGPVTFTAEITGTTCGTATYSWDYEPLATCDTTFNYAVKEGAQYDVTFAVYDYAPEFRRTVLYYNGFAGVALPNYSDYTNDINVFASAVFDVIANWGSDIDLSSVSVTRSGATVSITFKSTSQNDGFFYIITEGTDYARWLGPERPNLGLKTVLLNLNTSTAQSDITIVQSGASIVGQNNQAPTSVTGFLLEDDITNPLDDVTNNISIVLNPFQEVDAFGRTVSSPSCPDYTELTDVQTCPGELLITKRGTVHVMVFNPIVGESLDLGNTTWEVRDGSTTLFTFYPGTVTPDDYRDVVTEFKGNGWDVTYFKWLNTQGLYYMYVEAPVEYPNLNIIVNGKFGNWSLNQFYDIADCHYSNPLHPDIEVSYRIPTDASYQITEYVKRNMRMDESFIYSDAERNNLLTGSYNSGTGEIDVVYQISNTLNVSNNVELSFFNTYPTQSATPLISYTGTTSNVTGSLAATYDLQGDLAPLGYVPTDIAFYRLRDVNNGWEWTGTYVVVTTSDFVCEEQLSNLIVYGRGSHFTVYCSDYTALEVAYETNSQLCPVWNPSNLGLDVLLWNKIDAQTYTWVNNGPVSITQGSTTYTTISASNIVVGGLVQFTGGTSYYKIKTIVGTTVTLTTPITEITGTYNEYVAHVNSLVDSSPYAHTVAGVGNKLLYKELANGLYDGFYLDTNSYYQVTPITSANPRALTVFVVAKADATGSAILFSHRSTSNALVQFNITQANNSIAAQVRSSTGGTVYGAQTTVNSTTDYGLFSYDFTQGVSPALDVLRVWNNGAYANRNTVSANLGGDFTSTTQLIGAYFNGSSIVGGFAGTIQELIVTDALSLAETQMVEGYLAWKYSLQDRLPASHPYKTVRP